MPNISVAHYTLSHIQYLLSQGINPNARDDDGRTLLHLAVGQGNLPIVKYLIDQTADLNTQDHWGNTPLHLAVRLGSNLSIIQYLVEHGAQLNLYGVQGESVLHVAVYASNLAAIQYLLEKGANINEVITLENRYQLKSITPSQRYMDTYNPYQLGQNALLIAEGAHRNYDIILCLIAHGATVPTVLANAMNMATSKYQYALADIANFSFGILAEKRCLSIEFSNNSLAHKAVNQHSPLRNTIARFRAYYAEWQSLMGSRIEGLDEAQKKEIFREHCNRVSCLDALPIAIMPQGPIMVDICDSEESSKSSIKRKFMRIEKKATLSEQANQDDYLTTSLQSDRPSASTSKKIAAAIPRKPLKNIEKFQTLLYQSIPSDLDLGKAIDTGDCFFDALAQIINQNNNTNSYTAKQLRQLCHDFYTDNPSQKTMVDEWNKKDFAGIDRGDEYYFIQYTADELRNFFAGRTPIWGRTHIEGVILCHQLNLEGLCVIEIIEDPISKQPIIGFIFASKEGCRGVFEKQEQQSILRNPAIPVLVIEQNSLHFVPLLKKSLMVHESEPTEFSDQRVNPFTTFSRLTTTNEPALDNDMYHQDIQALPYTVISPLPPREDLTDILARHTEALARVESISALELTEDDFNTSMLDKTTRLMSEEPNIRPSMVQNALHFIGIHKRFDLTQHLIEVEKVDLHLLDNHQRSFLDLVLRSGETKILRYLVDQMGIKLDDLPTHLLNAVKWGHFEIVRYYIEEKAASTELESSMRERLMHFSIANDHLGIFQYLVETNTVDPLQPNRVQQTALHFAIECSRLAFVKYLTEICVADLNRPDSFRKTPLHLAIQKGNRNMVKYLIEHGATINLTDRNLIPFLSLALSLNVEEIIHYLIAHNANFLIGAAGPPSLSQEQITRHNELSNALMGFLNPDPTAAVVEIPDSIKNDPIWIHCREAMPDLLKKRALAQDFPDNLLAHVAINQNTMEDFRRYFDAWKIEMSHFIAGFDEPRILNRFKEACNIVQNPFAFSSRDSWDTFLLGRSERLSQYSYIPNLCDDVLGIIRQHIPITSGSTNLIFDVMIHKTVLRKTGLDENFRKLELTAVPESVGVPVMPTLPQERINLRKKRELAAAFPGNILAYKAIRFNTTDLFWAYYEAWKIERKSTIENLDETSIRDQFQKACLLLVLMPNQEWGILGIEAEITHQAALQGAGLDANFQKVEVITEIHRELAQLLPRTHPQGSTFRLFGSAPRSRIQESAEIPESSSEPNPGM